MGYESFKAMYSDLGKLYDLVILDLDNDKNRKLYERYMGVKGITVVFGDLLDKEVVAECIRRSDLCLHIAAFVSPAADYEPEKAMRINYGSVKNIIEAVKEQGREDNYKLVYHFGKSTTPDRPDQTWVKCLNFFDAGYTV